MSSMNDYNASRIRILSAQECTRAFQFVRVQQYAKQYPSVAIEFIDRLLTACAMSGFDETLAVRRYLAKDTSIPVTSELREVHRDLLTTRYNASKTA